MWSQKLPKSLRWYDGYFSRPDRWVKKHDTLNMQARVDNSQASRLLSQQFTQADSERKTDARRFNNDTLSKQNDIHIWNKAALQQRKAALQELLEREKYEQTQEILNSRRYFRPPYPPRDSLAPVPGLPRLDSLYHVQYVRPHEPPQPYAPPPPPPIYNVRDPLIHRHWFTKVPVASQMIKRPQLHIDGLKRLFPHCRGFTAEEKLAMEREERQVEREKREREMARARNREQKLQASHAREKRTTSCMFDLKRNPLT